MRQSTTAERFPGAAGRLALAALGAGLMVTAAAPLASAATGADDPGVADPAAAAAPQMQLTPATADDWSQLGAIKLYPVAGTGVDPLSNVIGTDLGGVPVSTLPVSQVFEDGVPVRDLPLIGSLFGQPVD